MARPPIKPRPRTEQQKDPIPNREAILKSQALVDAQLQIKDSADNAVDDREGRASRQALGEADPGGDASISPGATSGGAVAAPEGWRETLTEQERHEQRLSWFYSEASRQAANRREMALDEAYYDSDQWSREDRAEIEARGQVPVVYNEVKPTIDFLIGTERRSRVDFFVVAEEDDEGATDDAITKTKLLKYLEDVNLAPFERSTASDEAFKAGLGILECGLRGDKTGVPVFVGAETWRNFLHDSRAKRDQTDARYNFRVKEVDLDVLVALFPHKEQELKADSVEGDNMGAIKGLHGISGQLGGLDTFGFDPDTVDGGAVNLIDVFNARTRVTVIECWSREPVRKPMSEVNLGDPIEYRIRVALMTESTTLLETWSPYKHDRFPFILCWGYRNARTGMPYGAIRAIRGPQDGLNRRMTRSVFEASFNQMEAEEGAINRELMDEEQLQQEANDPTGFLLWANGALSGGKVRQRANPGAAREQMMLAEADRQTLRGISSVNEENRGLASSATSRVAMDAKAERGSVGVAELFDNLLLARQQEGEMVLSLCEQFVAQPMTIRVAGEQGAGKFERTKINQPALDPATGEPVFLNDITARRAHFVVGEQAWKQSYAEGAFNSLMQVLTQLAAASPEIVVALLDVVFDMHPNLPRKKTVIERIRAVNGQTDPDGKMTPEQQAMAAEKAAIAKAQFELQMAQLRADVKKAEAEGSKLDTGAIVARVQALYEAAQASAVLAQAPQLAPITDQILASAGFIDQSGSPATLGAVAPVPGMQPQPMAPPGPPQGPPGLVPDALQADGAMRGIETPQLSDGIGP